MMTIQASRRVRYLLPLLLVLAAVPARADDAKRVAVGTLKSPDASVIRREAIGKEWLPIKQGEEVFTKDLVLGVPYAEISLKSGVELDLVDNLDRRAPLPLIETAVILHENPARELDVTLDRGWISFANEKKEGEAKVDVRFRDQVWTITLLEPKARVSMEVFGRWHKGAHFTTKPGPEDVPGLDVVLLVLEGKVMVKTDCEHYKMQAPPGPALLHWDNVDGCDKQPAQLDKLPPWAAPADFAVSPEGVKRKVAVELLRKIILGKGVDHAISVFVNSPDPKMRQAAIRIMGATDNLERLGTALLTTKDMELWDTAVLTLRHWIGRAPGQDQLLYKQLIEKAKFEPGQAAIVMHLLHSFGDEITSCPECYEMLIEYLKHDKMAIRGLAQWHLQRLAPAGRKIQFNPAGSKEEWGKAYKAWKELIPEGKLPPVIEPEKDDKDDK
ncbi:MAG: hypothetical protein AB7K24_09015 [Gemmataceae bacterium]